jgi:hypothetical protein
MEGVGMTPSCVDTVWRLFVEQTCKPLPHQTGLPTIGISPLVNTVYETLLLKRARSKWAQVNQHTKAPFKPSGGVIFCWAVVFALSPGGPYARAR